MAERRVLLVEDDAAVRDSLEVLLSLDGYGVTSFGSAEAFLKDSAGASEGCLLLDVRMPGMDGLELLERLAARGLRLPVIVMTGHGDIPMAVRAMKAGALDFLEKPIDHERLRASLEDAFRWRSLDQGSGGPSQEVAKALESLTDREREVLECLIEGKPNKVIAYDLGISPRTVEVHRARVMDKMKADSLSQLVRMAISAGIAL